MLEQMLEQRVCLTQKTKCRWCQGQCTRRTKQNSKKLPEQNPCESMEDAQKSVSAGDT